MFIQTQMHRFYRIMQIHLLRCTTTNTNNKNLDLGIFKYMIAAKHLISEAVACMSWNYLHIKCKNTVAYCVILIHFRSNSWILFVYSAARKALYVDLRNPVEFFCRFWLKACLRKSIQIAKVNRNFSLLAFVLARSGTILEWKCVTLRHFFAVTTCMTHFVISSLHK
jgi:hypothetical protein